MKKVKNLLQLLMMLQGLTRKIRHSLPLSRYNILHVYTKQFSHDAFAAKIQICNRYVLQEVKCKQQSQLFRITRHATYVVKNVSGFWVFLRR